MSKIAYQPGDVIDSVEPFARIIMRDMKGVYCEKCFKYSESLKRCNKCKDMFYCSRACQNEDWKRCHKLECSPIVFTKLEDLGLLDESTLRQSFRIWALLNTNPSLADKKFSAPFNDTEISFNDIKEKYKSQVDHHIIQTIANTMAITMNLDAKLQFKLDDILEILVVQNVTSYPIFDDSGVAVIGLGIYPEIDIYKHSCRPNTYFSCFSDLKGEFRVISPINVGEPPTMSLLLQFNAPRDERHNFLQENFKMSCNCEICELEVQDPMIDYKELKNLMEKMEKNCELLELPFTDVVETHRKLIELLRTIYNGYDKRIIAQYLLLLHTLVQYTVEESEMETRTELMDAIKEHVGITFGPDFCKQKTFKRFAKIILGQAKTFTIIKREDGNGEANKLIRIRQEQEEEEELIDEHLINDMAVLFITNSTDSKQVVCIVEDSDSEEEGGNSSSNAIKENGESPPQGDEATTSNSNNPHNLEPSGDDILDSASGDMSSLVPLGEENGRSTNSVFVFFKFISQEPTADAEDTATATEEDGSGDSVPLLVG